MTVTFMFCTERVLEGKNFRVQMVDTTEMLGFRGGFKPGSRQGGKESWRNPCRTGLEDGCRAVTWMRPWRHSSLHLFSGAV